MIKKFVFAAALFLVSLCFADNLSAGNFGLTGGANFHTVNLKGAGGETLTQWNVGVVGKFNLPLGLQLHPALLYNVKAGSAGSAPVNFSVGYLELMASAQWGLDLILLRPYLEVSPFVGYCLNGWGRVDPTADWRSGERLEYGLGLGGGLQIWRFQVAARYNWSFTDIKTPENVDFNGVTLSLTYFFGNKKKR